MPIAIPCDGYTHLGDVAAVSHDDIWAVGECDDHPHQQILTRVMHWNGARFSRVPSPNPHRSDRLEAVSVLSDSDVWVAGQNGGGDRSVVMRYDGAAWHVVPSAHIPAVADIQAFSDTDVWVAGERSLSHWDGARWQTESFPVSFFAAIAGAAPDDLWAVGAYDTQDEAKTDAGRYDTYATHWDGSSWTEVALPKAPGLATSLTDVSVAASDDVWMVGGYKKGSAGGFVEHWDGTQWAVTKVYRGDDPYTYGLNAVTALGADDVWAGGDIEDAYGTTHWDGSTWTPYAMP